MDGDCVVQIGYVVVDYVYVYVVFGEVGGDCGGGEFGLKDQFGYCFVIYIFI